MSKEYSEKEHKNGDSPFKIVYPTYVVKSHRKFEQFKDFEPREINDLKRLLHKIFDRLWKDKNSKKEQITKSEKELRTFFYSVIGAILEDQEQAMKGGEGSLHMGALSSDISEEHLKKFQKFSIAVFWLRQVDKEKIVALRSSWNDMDYESRKNHDFIKEMRNSINGININNIVSIRTNKQSLNIVSYDEKEIDESVNKGQEVKTSHRKGKKKRRNKKGNKYKEGDNLEEILQFLKKEEGIRFKLKAKKLFTEIRELALDEQDERRKLTKEEEKTLTKLSKELKDIYELILKVECDDAGVLRICGYCWEKGFFDSDENNNLINATKAYLKAYKHNKGGNRDLLCRIISMLHDKITKGASRYELNKEVNNETLEDIKDEIDKVWFQSKNNKEELGIELLYLRMKFKYYMFYVKGIVGAAVEFYVQKENKELKEVNWGRYAILNNSFLCSSVQQAWACRPYVVAYVDRFFEDEKNVFKDRMCLPVNALCRYYGKKKGALTTTLEIPGYIDATLLCAISDNKGFEPISRELDYIITTCANIIISKDEDELSCDIKYSAFFTLVCLMDGFENERSKIWTMDKESKNSLYNKLEEIFNKAYQNACNILEGQKENNFLANLLLKTMCYNNLSPSKLGNERFIIAYLYCKKAINMGNNYVRDAEKIIDWLKDSHKKIVEKYESELSSYLNGTLEDKILCAFYEKLALWLNYEVVVDFDLEVKECGSVKVNSKIATCETFARDLGGIIKREGDNISNLRRVRTITSAILPRQEEMEKS